MTFTAVVLFIALAVRIQIEVVDDVCDVRDRLARLITFRRVLLVRLLSRTVAPLAVARLLLSLLDPSVDKWLNVVFILDFAALDLGSRVGARLSESVVHGLTWRVRLFWGALFHQLLHSLLLNLELLPADLHRLVHVKVVVANEFRNALSDLVDFRHLNKQWNVLSEHPVVHIIIPTQDG